MNVNPIGTPLPSSGGQFLRVKNVGDKVTFRIGQDPVYEGKHFQQDGEKWTVLACPRLNDNEECEICEKFFQIKADAKKAKDIGDTNAKDLLDKEARHYAVSTAYYFPILNRDTGKMAILQTTAGVKGQMDLKAGDGVKVFERDWILRNTGSKSPKDLYSLTVVDSADTKPLTEDEKAELAKAVMYDVTKINSGSTSNDSIAEVKETDVTDEDLDKI